jgi:hypothetical protein
MLISPIGALIVGPLAVFFGITNLFIVSAILGVSVTLLIYFFSGIRKLEYGTGIISDSASEIETPSFIE